MAGSIEGKFKVLHTVKDRKKLGAVAGRLGIEKDKKKERLKGASRKVFIVEEIKGQKFTRDRKDEPE
jgi:hypothetical protein